MVVTIVTVADVIMTVVVVAIVEIATVIVTIVMADVVTLNVSLTKNVKTSKIKIINVHTAHQVKRKTALLSVTKGKDNSKTHSA